MSKESFVTRADAEAQWSISRSSLIRAEKKKQLNADRREGGEVYYARHEVDALAAKMRRSVARGDAAAAMDGEMLASIFDRLGKHVTLADVVCQTRLHPDVVENIAARWRRMKEVVFTLTFADVADLLDAIGFVDGHPTVRTFPKLLQDIREHQAALGEYPPVKESRAPTASKPTVDEAAAPELVDLLADLTEADRKALLADEGFLSAVREDLSDLEQGDVTHAQAMLSIQRAKARAVKMLREGQRSGSRKKRPRKAR